jgi:hypothetical protein
LGVSGNAQLKITFIRKLKRKRKNIYIKCVQSLSQSGLYNNKCIVKVYRNDKNIFTYI